MLRVKTTELCQQANGKLDAALIQRLMGWARMASGSFRHDRMTSLCSHMKLGPCLKMVAARVGGWGPVEVQVEHGIEGSQVGVDALRVAVVVKRSRGCCLLAGAALG